MRQTRPIEVKKYEYIDVLRGAAILCVIAVHSHQQIDGLTALSTSIFNYGQLGVQLFFVASALTLCLSMRGRKENSPKNFYLRRYFRIAPLYYFGIVFYFFLRLIESYFATGNFSVDAHYSFRTIAENVFFVHGFDPANYNFVVPGGWSIATEMMFYLIFPILFYIQRKLSPQFFFLFSVAISSCCFLLLYVSIEHVQPHLLSKSLIGSVQLDDRFGFLYASIINQLPVFLIGIMTFRLLDTEMSKLHLIFAFLLIVLSVFLLNTTQYKSGYNGFFFPMFSAIAFGICSIKLSKITIFKGFASRSLIEIGKLSFSMYILHFFVLDVCDFIFGKTVFEFVTVPELKLALLYITASIFTFISARFTNKYIEKSGIKLGKRFIERSNVRQNSQVT